MNKTRKGIIALFFVGSAFAALTMKPKCPCNCNPGNELPKVIFPPHANPPTTEPSLTTPSSADHKPSTPSSTKVIAYYFHRTVRCHTCLAIEDLSRQTIENIFGEELGEGRIEWRPVNIEQKGNEHFEDDFKLKNQSLVLVQVVDGKEGAWKNLTSVWDLIGNPEAFIKYVQEELSKHLRGA